MKKLKKLRSKIIMFMLAIALPLSVCGVIYSTNIFSSTTAETATTASYYKSYISEVTMSNNNFSSSSSTYTLSTSLTGWSGQNNNRKSTAGVINVGSSFQSNMTGTYYLSSNPLAKASDKYIMMINSKTSKTDYYSTAKQGYKSSSISLDANSYYSLQVSFKSDQNYISEDTYLQRGTILEDDYQISSSNFNTVTDGEYTKFGGYIQFTYDNTTFYLLKELNETEYDVADIVANLVEENTDEAEQEDEEESSYVYEDAYVFYEEEDETGEYVGVLLGSTPYYIPLEYVEAGSETGYVNIKSGAKAHICSITYKDGYYYVASGTAYYEKSTSYSAISALSYGSIYLSGLTDEDGNDVGASFKQVSSDNWVTFYFFVATGDEKQSVSLELWLGSKDSAVSGVVFYDDCHVYQYSENAFWKTYANYINFNYTQEWSTSGDSAKIETVTTNCTQLINLQNDEENSDYADFNFDFEAGIYNSDPSSLLYWKRDENSTGSARVFDVNSPEFFKTTTGYDFVGSDLSCSVNLDTLEITENNYVLALWAKDEYSKVTSKDISINANEIYKITVEYKISSLTSGSVYVAVTEDEDFVIDTYDLSEYTPTSETQSSGVSDNGSDAFTNDYGTIEFYVKGNSLYNSSINISLCLGTSDETATGCVVFDNIKIEKGTSDEFSDATNSMTLGDTADNVTVTNGNFNNVTVEGTHPYAPENWTISSGDGTTYGGVINTDELQFAEYQRLYEENLENGLETSENPYYWVEILSSNPTNANGKTTPDNILMLANITSTWQNVKSDSISMSSGANYKLSFSYKTVNLDSSTHFTVSIYGEDDFELFTSESLSSNGEWSTYTIYFTTFTGATDVTVKVDFGTDDDAVKGFLFLDNFRLESGITIPDNANLIDMTDFYLNIPANNITDSIFTSSTPAYTGSRTSGSGEGITGGIVTSDMFNNNENSIYKISDLEEDETKNVFFISCLGEGSYAIQSNFGFDLTASTYYKLSFKLKTNFNTDKLDKDEEYSYGVTVGLTGFDYATRLISSDDFETYELFFYPSEDATAQLYICLICDSDDLVGSMALYDLAFEESNETEYTSAKSTANAKSFDVNSDRVYTCAQDDTTEEDDTTDTDSESTSSSSDSSAWLYIPTIIFALAIIIAVVGFFMRKVKIKKIEIKRKETYDRKSSLNVDAVKKKAKELQQQEIKEVEQIKQKFQTELDNMEELHKQKVLNLRQKDKDKVSKETDKEFKQFAQKRTVIAEKIDSLQKQIDEIKTPEYLLNLERKVFLDEEAKRRELAHYSKKQEDKQEAEDEKSKSKPKQKKTKDADEKVKKSDKKGKDDKSSKKDNK